MSIFETFLKLPGADGSFGSDANRRLGQIAARLVLAAAAGLAIGVVTEWSVLHLSSSLEPLSNTAAPWVLVAFAVALTARGMRESLMLAVLALIALIAGFYLAEALRGWAVSRHQVVFWAATSVVAGPLIGLAAGWLRHAGRMAGAVGAGVLGGVLVGEAVHFLTQLEFSSDAGYWHVQLAIGVGLTAGLTLSRCRDRPLGCVPALALSAVACAIVALGTLAVYQIP